jgi:hypothetical protein
MRLEGLGQLKLSTSLGLEPAAFRLVALVPQPTTLPHATKDIYITVKSFDI